jgi:diguanylate cyclase (GGDEF)-like protein
VDRVLGRVAGSMLGERLADFLPPDDRERTATVLNWLAGAEPGASRRIDWRLNRCDGAVLDGEAVIINYLDDPRLGGFVLNVRDVTERRRLENELEHRVFHDHLTGLANRALLENRLCHALGRSARSVTLHGIAFLDLDDFKAVNDSLGHAVGDELLVAVARRLQLCVRGSDTLARLGGDEFAVLLEDVEDAAEAELIAQRMVDSLREPFTVANTELGIGASVGVALSDGSGPGTVEDRAGRMLRNSDLAMYEAKRVGTRTVELYAPEMHDAVTRRLELKSELQLGLARDEFVIHYQPIIALADGSVAGFEALVRWNHPTRGFLSPLDFIPVAESSGLIVDLGHQVLLRACRQLAEWNAKWPARRYMSVNVAGMQLQRDEFVGEVAAALEESGIAPEQLLLEVTETALVRDTAGSERRLREVRELGVRLAIDDFGTGYSSLNYLRQFSMDVLKIDKSFIDSVADETRDGALVNAMVAMGETLGLLVVAEGIEEAGQVDALLKLGCPLGQGYYFARPSAPEQIEELIALELVKLA